MILPDVNVLIYAFRRDAIQHRVARSALDSLVTGEARFGISPLTLSAVVRVTTAFRPDGEASSLEEAFGFCDELCAQENCQIVTPADRHWDIFRRLCVETGTRGPKVSDAWFAALAIEWGCEWISFDRDFARFPGLKFTLLSA